MGKGTADGVHTSQPPGSSAAHSAARGHTPGTPTRGEAPLAGSQRHSDTHTHGHSRTEALKHGDTQQGRCSNRERHTTETQVHPRTKTLKHRHTFTADTFKYRVAHTNRDTRTQAGTHTRNTRARSKAGRETAVPPGRSRPTPRLQTLRSSRPTDLHKHFDNHSSRGLIPPPRARLRDTGVGEWPRSHRRDF